MNKVVDRLSASGFVLPPCPPPGGNYAGAVQSGRLVFLSGAIGTQYKDGAWSLPFRGALGGELDVDSGRASARLCVLNHLAALQEHLGDLERVKQVVKLTGYVYSTPDFTKAPLVLDAASDLLVMAFGDPIGRHARVAAYQHTMSFRAPIETELLVEVD